MSDDVLDGIGEATRSATLDQTAQDKLRSYVERIERLEEERAAIGADIREVYAEAKVSGFDTKVLRHVVKLRRTDKKDRDDFESLVEVYMHALGDFATTELGEAALESARAADAEARPKPRMTPIEALQVTRGVAA